MALINCPECETKVSEMATKCPSCGVQLRKPTRGGFGKLVKWAFIAFNALMAIWMVGGMSAASKGMEGLSGAEQAGAAIGTGIGAIVIGGIWFFGAFILGLFVLFTRPKA